ncbi:PLS3 [Cordylochernes scorpioides]|uniref:PLS3 n=1 Tax=Cordylochernes scorpioides TaxID=51811 RepID=A0ABY6KJW3_9ARAC|nr:PLS3 [Cordylochernes scorpioides]
MGNWTSTDCCYAAFLYDRSDKENWVMHLDKDGSGFLEMVDLKEALDIVGFRLPQWEVRLLTEEMERDQPTDLRGKMTFNEFQRLCGDIKSRDVANTFKGMISRRENLETLGGMSTASSEGTTHTVRQEEQVAFSDWINSNLGSDPDLKHILPIDQDGRALYDKVKDGILLCKIINHSCPDTIDERAINKRNQTVYTRHENLTLALNSAQAIGCNIINIDAHDLARGKPHLVLGLLWQIIRDSEIYTYLLKQIAPPDAGVTTQALMTEQVVCSPQEPDLLARAEQMLQQAEKLGCRSFLTPANVVEGVYKLNLAFVANLFNNHPGLDSDGPANDGEYESLEETREEKTYRNWMNSMGVNPYVNWLYSDLSDGLVVFQLFDLIEPGVVDWNKIHRRFSKLKGFMERLENCNYAVQLGRQLNFSLVGIAGHDLSLGNSTFTLEYQISLRTNQQNTWVCTAIVWQLMRAYTLSILGQVTGQPGLPAEAAILEWANKKLREAHKASSCIRSFQDSKLASARPVLDLLEAVKPGSVSPNQVLPGDSPQERLDNAKYAISTARKIGARIYALPEDIAELKPKMIMTVFACLMARDHLPAPRSAL